MRKFSFKENYELIALFDPVVCNLISISRKLKDHPELDDLICQAIALAAQFSLKMNKLQTEDNSNDPTTTE